MSKDMEKATEAWRNCLETYELLKEKHEVFCQAAYGVKLDLAGPGLKEALHRLFHKRRFSMFLEDLQYEDFRKGGISQLMPPKSSSGKSKRSPSFGSEE